MPFRGAGGARFYHRSWRAESPHASLLFLHGYGEHSGHYHRFACQLAAADIDVWMPDHIGHGHTGPRNGRFASIAALAENAVDMANYIRHESPRIPLVLGGHSLGGLTATLAASMVAQAPSGLVLTGTPFDGLLASAARNTNPVMSLDPAYLDALDNDPLTFDSALAETQLWDAVDAVRPILLETVAGLDMPVLLVNGDRDVFAPPQVASAWADRFPDATSTVIAGGHHDIPNDVSHWGVCRTVVKSIDAWTAVSAEPVSV